MKRIQLPPTQPQISPQSHKHRHIIHTRIGSLNRPGVGWVHFLNVFKVRVSIRTCVQNLGAFRRPFLYMRTITNRRTRVDKCGEDLFVSLVRCLQQHFQWTFRTQHGHKICQNKSKLLAALRIAAEYYRRQFDSSG